MSNELIEDFTKTMDKLKKVSDDVRSAARRDKICGLQEKLGEALREIKVLRKNHISKAKITDRDHPWARCTGDIVLVTERGYMLRLDNGYVCNAKNGQVEIID